MTAQTDRLKAVFLAAMEESSGPARTAFLDKACADDLALRQSVAAMLRAHDQIDPLLDLRASELLDATSGEFANPDHVLSFLGPSSQPDSLGRLDHYEVLQIVGRGSMGLVLRSYDEKLNRVVAIKILAPQLAASAPARLRFSREARAAAAVTHENVIAIHAVENAGMLPYLVMPFVDGPTLQEKLERFGAMSLQQTLRIGLQLAEGLAAAHSQGLVHRDVKPANILLENGIERVKLTDFGLARTCDDASVTQSGVLAGTPMYMSPEQAEGRPLDFRSDLFSLGSVLYKMCTGRSPFRATTSIATLKRVCEQTPQPIHDFNPDLPQWLVDIVSRLHAKNQADRFASARELADLLARRLAELQPDNPEATRVIIPPRPSPTSTRRWITAAAMLLLLGGLAITEATGVTNVRGNVVRMFTAEERLQSPAVYSAVTTKELDRIAWGRSVAAMAPAEQVKEVGKRLKDLNPGFDRELKPTIENGTVTGLEFYTNEVVDISPLRALPELQSLSCEGLDGKGKLADLSPLKGLKLRNLNCSGNPITSLGPLREMPLTNLRIRNGLSIDLSPLEGMRLIDLECGFSGVADLSPLRGMKLKRLLIDHSPVRDLSPLQGMPLTYLNFGGSMMVVDLAPLQGMPLTHLFCNDTRVANLLAVRGMPLREIACDFKPERGDGDILRPIKTLEIINFKQAARFWNERVQALVGFPPLPDAEIQRIAGLPALNQIEEVRKALQLRNPDFNGVLTPTIVDGAVTQLRLSTNHVSDIAPVRALTRLKELYFQATPWTTGKLIDLEPLRGLMLTLLDVSDNPVYDLSPLKEMKLNTLKCSVTKVSDLSPLQGMPLQVFHCAFTRVADLTPLKGMKLRESNIEMTRITDLTPLKGMPLSNLNLYGLNRLTDITPLQGMPLEMLNLQNTAVSDLTPLKGMPLVRLNFPGTPVFDVTPLSELQRLRFLGGVDLARLNDLSPLKQLPLEELHVKNFHAQRDGPILRGISTLKAINGYTAAEFWKDMDKKKP